MTIATCVDERMRSLAPALASQGPRQPGLSARAAPAPGSLGESGQCGRVRGHPLFRFLRRPDVGSAISVAARGHDPAIGGGSPGAAEERRWNRVTIHDVAARRARRAGTVIQCGLAMLPLAERPPGRTTFFVLSFLS